MQPSIHSQALMHTHSADLARAAEARRRRGNRAGNTSPSRALRAVVIAFATLGGRA
jgi:hypothetical protein